MSPHAPLQAAAEGDLTLSKLALACRQLSLSMISRRRNETSFHNA
jgi:hypothetical protein